MSATIFVLRDSYRHGVTAAVTRMAATSVRFGPDALTPQARTGKAPQMNALRPVIARPTISVLISRVPS